MSESCATCHWNRSSKCRINPPQVIEITLYTSRYIEGVAGHTDTNGVYIPTTSSYYVYEPTGSVPTTVWSSVSTEDWCGDYIDKNSYVPPKPRKRNIDL